MGPKTLAAEGIRLNAARRRVLRPLWIAPRTSPQFGTPEAMWHLTSNFPAIVTMTRTATACTKKSKPNPASLQATS
jgi:hypothetical protein